MRNNFGRIRKIIAASLMPLLLLATLPGCVARHMPDWSRVQDVNPDTQTEVQLYEEATPQRNLKTKGRFLSATDNAVTLQLKDGQTETFQRKDIRKVLAYRELGKRWPGWLALGIAFAFGGNAFRSDADVTAGGSALIGAIIPVSISAAFFHGSRMGGIYEVPPKHRDWYPQEASSSGVGTEKAEDEK